ncbi:class I SAM-dependent methyltransferase [Candidatus Leptofilum sp.]|uniref:class I SAM-dependent methyltransferase n=1 Tax=Candidatus Leptofilum sp. TaxID=3241576 RepID=UPI003B5A139F
MSHHPTQRFSNRVKNYVKYRPSYPTAVVDCLQDECGLVETAVIADIGSGTGILARLFLQNGNRVLGIEPNKEMREAGEAYLAEFANFTSLNGTAEATTLPDDSVDFVTAGQAAHWFDKEKSLPELQRILKPGGTIAFVWNTMAFGDSPFMRGYEQITLRYFDGKPSRKNEMRGNVMAYLGEGTQVRHFACEQQFDLPGITGRLLSTSYAPLADDPRHGPMLAELAGLFAENVDENGRIRFLYTTELYFRQF